MILDVGLDLDGCFCLFDQSYYRGCVRVGKIDMHATPYVPAAEWSFYTAYGHDLTQFLANCDQLADLGLLWNMPVLAPGKSAWLDLASAGHRLHVKTDRAFGARPQVSEAATFMWLDTHGLPRESVTFGSDKTAGPRCDVMLEDKIENYDALDAAGVHVWLLNRRWNRAPGDTRRRVANHDAFVAAVALYADEKQGAMA